MLLAFNFAHYHVIYSKTWAGDTCQGVKEMSLEWRQRAHMKAPLDGSSSESVEERDKEVILKGQQTLKAFIFNIDNENICSGHCSMRPLNWLNCNLLWCLCRCKRYKCVVCRWALETLASQPAVFPTASYDKGIMGEFGETEVTTACCKYRWLNWWHVLIVCCWKHLPRMQEWIQAAAGRHCPWVSQPCRSKSDLRYKNLLNCLWDLISLSTNRPL